MMKFKGLIVLQLLVFTLLARVNAQNWIIKYDSEKRSVRCFTVTYEAKNQFGTVWWPNKMDLSTPIELNFVIYMGQFDGSGADGMAFVMHNDPRGFDAIGDAGGGLGYAEHPSGPWTHEKIVPSVAIEFDTWYNKQCGTSTDIEIKEDHTTVVYNGDVCNPQFPPIPIKPNPPFAIQNVEDNVCYNYTIRISPNADGTHTIKTFIEGDEIFSYTDNIVNDVFGGDPNVYYGFTGSTGGSINEQTVCLLGGNTKPFAVADYAATSINTPVFVNVTNNDYDTDGDSLDTLNVVTGPKHGTATYPNKDSIYYEPDTDFVGVDSIQYVVCDINSFKCYAKCDTATIYIDVLCDPYSLTVEHKEDNAKCADSIDNGSGYIQIPDNGKARAYYDDGSSEITAGYTFNWIHAENDSLYHTGPQPNNLRHGDYKVVAVHNSSGCISDTSTVSIDSIGYTPDLTIVENAQLTDCNNPNGELEVFALEDSVDETANYNFQWFEGTQIYVNDHGVGNIATGLKATNYTVLATSKISGCSNNKTSTVSSSIAFPSLTVDDVQDVKNCKSPNDGSIMVSSDLNDSFYTFDWYQGPSVKATGPDYLYDGSELTNLEAGYYTVTATLDSNGCTSIPQMVEITSKTETPNIHVDIINPPSSCIPSQPNGHLLASASGTSSTTYTFKWYKGSNKINPPFITNDHAENLAAGTYTLVVTGNAFVCETDTTFTLQDSTLQITVNPVNIQAQTDCDPANGSATVSADGGYGNYDFYWFNNSPGSPLDTTSFDYKGITYNGLQAGNYWVYAVDKYTRCISDSLVISIQENLDDFSSDINLSVTPQSSCVISNPNGQLSADVAGNSVDYTFRWFKGQFAPGTIPAGTGLYTSSQSTTNAELEAGIYTVFVKSNISGCEYAAEATVTTVQPTITVSSNPTDQTFCDPANGAIDAIAGGGTGYDFYYYDSHPGSIPDTTVADYKGQNYTGLLANTYYLVASDQYTRCLSELDTVVVAENTPDFSADINISDIVQSSCDLTNPNGQLSADVNGNTSDYTFRWFDSQFAPGTIPTGTGLYSSSQATTDTELSVGIYTAFVKSSINGCEYGVEGTVTNNFPTITVSTTATDQSYCDPANGAATATAAGAILGVPSYDIYWYNSNPGSLPDTTNYDSKGNTYPGLAAGSYYAIAIDKATRCQSELDTAIIADITTDFTADINLSVTPQSSCDLTNPNGQISADVGGTTAGYSFRWFAGHYAPGTIPSGSGLYGSSQAITNAELAAGTYTVFVRDNTTGCEFSKEATINNVFPTITVSTSVTGQSFCDPANGAVSATANGALLGGPSYDIYWYETHPGTLPDTTTFDAKGVNYTGLVAADYYVIAVDEATRCQSALDTATVADLTPDFSASINLASVPTSACDPALANGQLSVDVAGNTTNYTFRWFNGQFAPGTIPAGNGLYASSQASTDNELNVGVYTVFAKSTINGCEFSAESNITESLQTISITANVLQDQINCTPAMGSIEADGSGGYGTSPSYDYYWYDTDPGNAADTTVFDFKGKNYTDLEAGDYWVIAADKATRCTSDTLVRSIAPPPAIPAINFIVQDYESCDPNFPNGQITADVGGVTAGYSFEWFAGKSTDPSVSLPNGSYPSTTIEGTDNEILNYLPAGDYRLRVTDNITQCQKISDAIVGTINPIDPVLDNPLTINTHLTDCNNPDGTISATVDGGLISADGYTFHWFASDITDYSKKLSTETETITGLNTGEYAVIAINDFTKCVSVPLNTQVAERDTAIIEVADVSVVNCNATADVTANVSVNTGIYNTSDYDFLWIDESGSTISTSNTATGISVGTYNIIASNNISGCITEDVFNLKTNDVTTPVPFPSSVDALTCGGSDGAFDVNITRGDSITPINPADCDIYWFEGTTPKKDGLGNYTPDYTDKSRNDIPAGTYTIVVRDIVGPNDCPSPAASVVINDPPTPAISVVGVDNTICAPGTPNGEISATANMPTGPEPSDYTFDFYNVATSNLEHSGVTKPTYTFTDVAVADYLIRVQNNETLCVDTSYFTVEDKTIIPTIDAQTINHQVYCDPNGEIEITSISTGGVPSLDYDYVWHESSPSGAVLENGGTPINSNFVDELSYNKYYVEATLKSTFCKSTPVEIEVLDQRDYPSIILDTLIAQHGCDPINPNGEIRLTADETIVSADLFTFELFDTGGLISNVNNQTNHSFTGLDDKTYRVEVTSETTSCTTTRNYTVQEKIELPTLNLTNQLDQTYCFGNGLIEVSGDHPDTPNFTYEWFQGTLSNQLSGEASEILDDVASDTYFVIAVRDDAIACKSLPYEVEIKDIHTNPIISVDSIAPQTSCIADNGTIAISVSEFIPGADTYEIDWSFQNNTGITKDTVYNLSPANYQVQVMNETTLCSSQKSIIVNEQIVNPTISLVNKADQTYCIGNGTIEVLGVHSDNPNFIYEWYQGNKSNLMAGEIAPINNDLSADSYFVKAVRNDAIGCKSDFMAVNLADSHTDPIISVDSIADQTSCLAPNGTIAIAVSEVIPGPDTYTVDWSFQNTSGIILDTVYNLPQGAYAVNVLNETTQCTGQKTIQVNENITLPTISLVDKIDQSYCIGNGEIEVEGHHSESPSFTYEWFKSNLTNQLVGESLPTINDLLADAYFVKAVRNDAIGCKSNPFQVNIDNISTNPVLAVTNLIDQTNCDPATNGYNGEITLEANEISGTPNTYTFSWTDPGIAPNIVNGATQSVLNNAMAGAYQATVTNNLTQCVKSIKVNLDDLLEIPTLSFVSKSNQTLCVNGDGHIEVSANPSIHSFTYDWFQANYSPINQISGENNSRIEDLASGTFYVTATRDDNFCESEPMEVEILDISTNPIVEIALIQEQMSIAPALPTAELEGSARETDASIGLYNYIWTYTSDTVATENNVVTTSINQRPAGDYKLLATNASTGCLGQASIMVVDNPAEPDIIAFHLGNMDNCVPADGRITVDSVTINNIPDQIADYEYYWFYEEYHEDLNQADYITNGATTDFLDNLQAGEYFVVAREKTLNVRSLPLQITIDDQATYPIVELAERNHQTSCDPDPQTHNGSLSVMVDYQTNPVNYDFEWFLGDAQGQNLNVNDFSIGGLTVGDYTVAVTNQTSGCTTNETYFIKEDIQEIKLNVSASPNINCIDPNGQLMVSGTNIQESDYHFLWFAGSEVDDISNPMYQGTMVQNVSAGYYSIVANDRSTLTCFSEPQTVEVKNIIKDPKVELSVDASSTHCQPQKANGQLSMLMDDNISNYQIDWYKVGVSSILSNNAVLTEQMPGEYFVYAQNSITGCEVFSDTINLMDNHIDVINPSVNVISELHRCDFPTGEAHANVDGNVSNYIFSWIDANDDTLYSDVNYIMDSLYMGEYAVTAEDRVTGCISEPTTFDITDQTVYPAFSINTEKSSCEETDGLAIIKAGRVEDVNEVSWYNQDNDLISNFLELSGVPAGEYHVVVTGSNGCSAEQDFELAPDINVYNGISANGDGSNDYWHIGCIENYPQNIIKVFNRSGGLVFEANGYDNAQNIFDGLGNRGLYLGNKELPVGTYFYMISTENNSEPKTGYLELIR